MPPHEFFWEPDGYSVKAKMETDKECVEWARFLTEGQERAVTQMYFWAIKQGGKVEDRARAGIAQWTNENGVFDVMLGCIAEKTEKLDRQRNYAYN